eukprot:TRINITY_DN5082_c0_g1_i2.p1 TRINITY_DN5082_c0_g1~~TRINITY_DN5082_c0_g1_i2.p1  ORF type:complete len:180 (-),score=19.51 TRINITY_DN5082_c0_g1_i2:119-628(-)
MAASACESLRAQLMSMVEEDLMSFSTSNRILETLKSLSTPPDSQLRLSFRAGEIIGESVRLCKEELDHCCIESGAYAVVQLLNKLSSGVPPGDECEGNDPRKDTRDARSTTLFPRQGDGGPTLHVEDSTFPDLQQQIYFLQDEVDEMECRLHGTSADVASLMVKIQQWA